MPETRRADFPQIPWRSAAGLRDGLADEYDKVIVEIVWRIVRDDLPALVRALEPLAQEPNQ